MGQFAKTSDSAASSASKILPFSSFFLLGGARRHRAKREERTRKVPHAAYFRQKKPRPKEEKILVHRESPIFRGGWSAWKTSKSTILVKEKFGEGSHCALADFLPLVSPAPIFLGNSPLWECRKYTISVL